MIAGEYPPLQGGLGDYTRQLARALIQRGWRVEVITSAQAGPVQWGEAGEPLVHPGVERWDFSCWRILGCELGRRHPRIVHLQYQTAAYGLHPAINLFPWWWRRGRREAGSRWVVTFHDVRLPYLFPKAAPLRRWATRMLMRHSDMLIVTNREDEQGAQGYRPGRPIHRIPIGSNIPPAPPPDYRRDEWRRRWGVAPDESLLAYFGFLNASKGGELLVRAVARLRAGGERVKLVMVGGMLGASDPTNSVYAQKVHDLIRQSGLEGAVLWTGFVEAAQVSAHLMAADLCVLPYLDGASLRRGSLMAALAHGLPILSTQPLVETSELVDGENIALVPCDDLETLTSRIRKLLRDEGARRRLGEGARRLAENFTWDKIAQETEGLYRQLIEQA